MFTLLNITAALALGCVAIYILTRYEEATDKHAVYLVRNDGKLVQQYGDDY